MEKLGGRRRVSLSHEMLPSVTQVLKQNSPFRPEVQALGLTVLVDARICSPNSLLIWGLSQLQVSRGLWLLSVQLLYCQWGRAELWFLAGSSPRTCTRAANWKDARENAYRVSGTEPSWQDGGGDLCPHIPASCHLLLQVKHLPSHQSLLTHIPNVELPTSLGGCLSYCHRAWLDFRMVSAPGWVGRLWLSR